MMISIYSEMIPYHFTVDWYDFYRTDIFHDFTTKNKIKIAIRPMNDKHYMFIKVKEQGKLLQNFWKWLYQKFFFL